MSRRFLTWIVAGVTLVATLSASALVDVRPAKAIDTSLNAYLNNQHYNNLVSDADFLNLNSMDVGAIQAFLVRMGSYLAVAPPEQLGDGANGRSAAQIIFDASRGTYDAAAGCAAGVCVDHRTGTINPQAIMLILQREQSLITVRDHQPNRLRTAMGYGCPDSGGCNPIYAGFSNQVGWGAWQLRWNMMAPINSVRPYFVGNTMTISARSGARSVFFSNRATASLYRYTPHIYFGNYNFWRLGIEWFGFRTGDGEATIVNDTTSASGRMYAGRDYLIRSFKQSDVRVFFNGQVVADLGPTTWEHRFVPNIGTHAYHFEYRRSDGTILGTKVITIDKRKNGDINGDQRVSLLDLSLIGNAWGTSVKDDDWTNLNPDVDNEINLLDISIFANSWEG